MVIDDQLVLLTGDITDYDVIINGVTLNVI